MGFDEGISISQPRATVVLKPGVKPGVVPGVQRSGQRASDVWAIVVDIRMAAGVDACLSAGQAHDVVLHSGPTGGATCTLHPNQGAEGARCYLHINTTDSRSLA